MSAAAAFIVASKGPSSRREEEAHLVAQAKNGCSRSFGLLFEKARPTLFELCNKKGLQPADAQDILQNTALKCFRYLPNFRGDSEFTTWAYRITHNLIMTHYKSAYARGAEVTMTMDTSEEGDYFENVALHHYEDPSLLLIAEQTADTVQEAIAGMSEELREALELREMELLPYEVIAERQNVPVGTVRSRISRARDQVEKALAEAEEIKPPTSLMPSTPSKDTSLEKIWRFGEMSLNLAQKKFAFRDTTINLSRAKFLIMMSLFRHKGSPSTIDDIHADVNLFERYAHRTIRAEIGSLTKIFKKMSLPPIIANSYDHGYYLVPPAKATSTQIDLGGLKIDLLRKDAVINGQMVHLRKTEFAVLEALVKAKGDIVDQLGLKQAAEAEGVSSNKETMRTALSELRRKLKEAGSDYVIRTCGKTGYSLTVAREAPAPEIIGGITLDHSNKEIRSATATIRLTPVEYFIVKTLVASRTDRVLAKDIISALKAEGSYATHKSFISAKSDILKKLRGADLPDLIVRVGKSGFRFDRELAESIAPQVSAEQENTVFPAAVKKPIFVPLKTPANLPVKLVALGHHTTPAAPQVSATPFNPIAARPEIVESFRKAFKNLTESAEDELVSESPPLEKFEPA